MLEREIVRWVYEKAGVKIEDLPNGVFMEWRDGFFVAVNYTDQDFKLPVPGNSRILVGNNPLKPAQAIVWTLK
jgi:beta-galactosidase